MKTTKQVLQDALKLFGPRGGGWCQGEYAKTKEGEYVYFTSVDAARYCAIGAVKMVTAKNNSPQAVHDSAVVALARSLPRDAISIPYFNDARGRKFADIKKLFERAIASLPD